MSVLTPLIAYRRGWSAGIPSLIHCWWLPCQKKGRGEGLGEHLSPFETLGWSDLTPCWDWSQENLGFLCWWWPSVQNQEGEWGAIHECQPCQYLKKDVTSVKQLVLHLGKTVLFTSSSCKRFGLVQILVQFYPITVYLLSLQPKIHCVTSGWAGLNPGQ